MLSRKTKTLLFCLALLLLGVSVTSGNLDGVFRIASAHAAFSAESEELMNTIAKLITYAITAMNVLLWIVFRILEIVLDPVFMFDIQAGGADGPLLQMLHNIWMLTRDLMNIIFALLLVVGAVITIVKANTETVKGYRAKFVIAVILVNFSWFVPRVVLDVVQVLTYTVYQIPSMIDAGGAAATCKLPKLDGGIDENCFVVTDVKFLEETERLPGPKTGATTYYGWKCPLEGLVCFYAEDYKKAKVETSSVVINGLILNHAKLSLLPSVVSPKAAAPAAAGVKDESDVRKLLTFLIRITIILLLHIGMLFPLLAITVAFLIRIPILWVTMAFMPVAFLGFLIGDKLGGFNPMEIWKRFLSAAFLPALVAVPFAIGFVMINAGTSTPMPGGLAPLNAVLPLFAGVKDIWQLLWMLISFFILWTGVFMILNKDSIISKFTQPIEGFGKELGKFALKAPSALPILPGPGGSKASAGQYMKAFHPRNLNAAISDGSFGTKDDPFADLRLDRMLYGTSASQQENARKVIKNNKNIVTTHINQTITLDNATASAADQQAKIEELFNKLKNDGHLSDPNFRNLDKNTMMEALLHQQSELEDATKIKLRQALDKARQAAAPPPAAPGAGGGAPAPAAPGGPAPAGGPGGAPPAGAPPAPGAPPRP